MAAANYASALAYVTVSLCLSHVYTKHLCCYACAYAYACVVRVNQALVTLIYVRKKRFRSTLPHVVLPPPRNLSLIVAYSSVHAFGV